jgi:uncharacterized membrane protein
MGAWAQMLAEAAKKEMHWIWAVLLAVVAIIIIIRGVLAIRNRRVRLKYGIVKEGGAAVGFGVFFVVMGIVIIVITIITQVSGPLL